MATYDTIIIGAGVSGLFTALAQIDNQQSLLIVDIGSSLPDRLKQLGDRIATHKSSTRYLGFAGLGLSEGKFNFTNDFGGNLADKIGAEQSLQYQHKIDQRLIELGGGDAPFYSTENSDLSQKAKRYQLKILATQTRHLGTRRSIEVFKNMAELLSQRVEFKFATQIVSITKARQLFTLITSQHETLQCRRLVIATGGSGNQWLNEVVMPLGLNMAQTRLDLGFRIEMSGQQLATILEQIPETKIFSPINSALTYCMNPNGQVIRKHHHGLIMPDGQNSREQGATHNLNFTLFIPRYFARLDEAERFLHHTIGQINQQSDRILAQRLYQLDQHFLPQQTIQATLDATFSPFQHYVPEGYIGQTCQFLKQLEQLLAQPIDGNTILYAMDSKLYLPEVSSNRYFETAVAGLYLIGDCSGVTSSLSQAAASGYWLGEHLSRGI